MAWLAVGEHLTIGAKRFKAQIIEAVAAQDAIIAAVLDLLGEHPLYFLVG